MALTPKQERFVAEYLVDFNATAAAKRAGYSEKTAYEIAHQNMARPAVREAIDKAKKELEKRTEVTQEYVLAKLKEIADMEAGDMASYRVRVGNQLKALELLGKYLGMFDQRAAEQIRGEEDDPLTASLKELMEKP